MGHIVMFNDSNGLFPTKLSGFHSVSTPFLIPLLFCLFALYTATGILSNRGELVRFNCSVDSKSSVDWQFAKTKDSIKINIFIGNARRGGGHKSGGYLHRYRYHIQIDIQTGRYDLIINSVTKADEGYYFCTDVSNPDSTTTTNLTVLGEEELHSSSNDISAVVGDTVTLTFPTANKDSIQLEHRSVDRNYPLHVFRDGRLVNGYYALSGRFSFSASNGSWILEIKKVQSLDAGSFICSEDNGLGKQYVQELVVAHANEVVCSDDADKGHQELNDTSYEETNGGLASKTNVIVICTVIPILIIITVIIVLSHRKRLRGRSDKLQVSKTEKIGAMPLKQHREEHDC